MKETNYELTDREAQILDWIKQNPMISQNDLADLANISRSSVAVHISNLMKKGAIRGKGYIIQQSEYVTVVGGVNMDIFGLADQPIEDRSSNQGSVFTSIGGLGRNISLNLNNLEINNYFVTVYGNDADGEAFKADSLSHDLDITYAQQLMNEKTSKYLFVNQPNGERIVGIDAMGIFEKITPAFLTQRLEIIENANIVVIDTNLPEESIQWVTQHANNPVFAKAVSKTKAQRLKSSLSAIDTLVLNGIEAPVLSGLEAWDEPSARACGQALLEAGVQRVFLYIDEVGMLYMTQDQALFFKEPKIDRKNTNGAGAAAIAALVLAYKQQLSFEETAKVANAAAYLVMETYSPVNAQMSLETLADQQARLF